MVYRQAPGDGPILVVAFGGNVMGLEPASGKRVWHVQPKLGLGQSLARLLVTDDEVLLGAGFDLLSLDYLTGAQRWRTRLEHPATTLLVTSDSIFAGGVGAVTALTRKGERRWHEAFKGLGTAVVSLGVPGRSLSTDLGGT